MIFVGDTNNRRVVYPIIALVILFGFYLRVSNVFDQVPWDGEDFMAGRILESKDMVINSSFPGVSKPLWQLMIAFGYRVMGFRLFVGSLWSAYFGTTIIALIYKLCQRLFNNDIGFYAALFTASMLTFIHVSRLPRAPMASLFFMLFAANLYLKFAKKGMDTCLGNGFGRVSSGVYHCFT
jgi:4-amino-4-deoxy-L-arabinose transferase-like glycosyltransferase